MQTNCGLISRKRLFLSLLCTLMISTNAHSTSVIITQPEYNIKRATSVVEVVVVDINYEMSEQNVPFAVVRLQVVDHIIGELPEVFIVRRPFVTRNLDFLHKDVIPGYTIGERFITTIESHGSIHSLLGLHNGKFVIERGKIAGTSITAESFKEQVLRVRSGDVRSLHHEIPRHDVNVKEDQQNLIVDHGSWPPCADGIEYLDGEFWAWDFTWNKSHLPVRISYNPNHAPPGIPNAGVIAQLASLSYGLWYNDLSTLSFSNESPFTTSQGRDDNDISVVMWEDFGTPNYLGMAYPYPNTQEKILSCDTDGRGTQTAVDIVLNNNSGVNWHFDSSPPANHSSSAVDFVEVLAHELGHGLGLAHNYGNRRSIMYDVYNARAGSVRGLSGGDKAGGVFQHPVQVLSGGQLQHSLLLPGAEHSDYYVSGSFAMADAHLVLDDAKLTINHDATLTITNGIFRSRQQLAVMGTLNADDTIFDFEVPSSWNGIRFVSGSAGSVLFSTIKNARYGIYTIGVLPTIAYSRIEDNDVGILLNNVNTNSGEIKGNHIRENNNHGISLNYSSVRIAGNWIYRNANGIHAVYSTPRIYDNEIYDNGTGLNMAFYSPAQLRGYPTGNGHNLIYSNSTNTKIYADYHSNVSGYGNDIHSPFGYAVHAARNASVQMPDNFWSVPGTGSFHATGGAQIVYLPKSNEPFVTPVLSNAVRSQTEVPSEILAAASELMLRERYSEAITLYLDVLDNEAAEAVPDVPRQEYVLAQLAECYRAAGIVDFGGFLDKVVRPKLDESTILHAMTRELESLSLIREGRYDEAVEIMERLGSNRTADDGVRERAMFGLSYVYGVALDDVDQGQRYVEELAAGYPEGVLAAHARRLMGVGGEVAPRQSAGAYLGSREQVRAPERYVLFGNYPNPFSTSTTVHFSLPEATDVRVTVLDMLGREVMRPVDGPFEAGLHQVRVNATHLPPGVYLYSMSTPYFNESRRMMLIR